MTGGAAAEGIGADAIARGEFGGPDRLVGRNGDRAVGEVVELLPAGEQRLEGRVGLAGRIERAALRAVAADRVGVAELGDHFRIDLLTGDHRGENLLALLDLLDAGLGCGGKAGDIRRNGRWSGRLGELERGRGGMPNRPTTSATRPWQSAWPSAPAPKGAGGEDDCRHGQTGLALEKAWLSRLPGSWLQHTPHVTGPSTSGPVHSLQSYGAPQPLKTRQTIALVYRAVTVTPVG